MISFTKYFALIAAASSVLAQGGHQGFSQKCQQALVQLANNADASKCMAIPQILPVFANPDSSTVKPVEGWLNAVCSAQPCSDQTITTIVTTFIQGCPEEVKYLGINDASSAIETVRQLYPAYRKAICLRKSDNNLCYTETMTNYEKFVSGTLTYHKLGQFLQDDPMNLPSSVACTNCGKATYNAFQSFGPNPEVTNTIKGLCGTDFINGQHPSGMMSGQ